MNHPNPTPLSDSPWFWAYVFACGGLIALLVVAPKYQSRQTQLDQRTEGRIQAARVRAASGQTDPNTASQRVVVEGKEASTETAASPAFSLRPLYSIMLLAVVVALVRLRRRHAPPPGGDPNSNPNSDPTPPGAHQKPKEAKE